MTEDVRDRISRVANSCLKGKRQIKLLEAGCGSATHVKFEAPVYAVGIDISQRQLDRNKVVQEKILGDLQQFPLPKNEYDVAICWMVLEHLSNPKAALANLFDAVKPEGLLILGVPNLLSFKGLATKFTPHWFHTLFYRFMKYKSRPFPAYLRTAIIPKKLVRLAEQNDFAVLYFELMEGEQAVRVKNRFWIMKPVFGAANLAARILTLGKLPPFRLDNCFMVLQKRDGAAKQPYEFAAAAQAEARPRES